MRLNKICQRAWVFLHWELTSILLCTLGNGRWKPQVEYRRPLQWVVYGAEKVCETVNAKHRQSAIVGTFTPKKHEKCCKDVVGDKSCWKTIRSKEMKLSLFESAEGSHFMIFAIFVRLQFDYIWFCYHNLLHILHRYKYVKPFKG